MIHRRTDPVAFNPDTRRLAINPISRIDSGDRVLVLSIPRNQASVAIRLRTGLPRRKFALLAWPRTTSRATNSLDLFECGLLGLQPGSIRRIDFGESLLEDDMDNCDQYGKYVVTCTTDACLPPAQTLTRMV
jgi:hypothetical protein